MAGPLNTVDEANTRATPAITEAMVERAARAICELHIRYVRRFDTPPAKLEEMMADAVDYSWEDHEPEARAALTAALTGEI